MGERLGVEGAGKGWLDSEVQRRGENLGGREEWEELRVCVQDHQELEEFRPEEGGRAGQRLGWGLGVKSEGEACGGLAVAVGLGCSLEGQHLSSFPPSNPSRQSPSW